MTFQQAAAEARAWFAQLSDHEAIGHYLTALDEQLDTTARLASQALLGERPSWSTTTPEEWAGQYAWGRTHRTNVVVAWRRGIDEAVAS
jgi:hypothetical protein